MAHPPDHRFCSQGFVRCVLVLLILFLVGFIVRLWHVGESSNAQASCPSCHCDCSSDIISIPLGFLNSSHSDCGKNGPETNKEVGNDALSLLAEELSLQKNVADDNLKRKKAMIIDAKKTSSHYQKEAEKCNSGMETCEEARERAEAGLIEERKLSALWEKRAHELGWKDEDEYTNENFWI